MTNLGLTNDIRTDAQTDDAALAAGAGHDVAAHEDAASAAGHADASFSSEHASGSLDGGGGLDGALEGAAGAGDESAWASLDGAFDGWADAMGDLMAQIGGSLSAMFGL